MHVPIKKQLCPNRTTFRNYLGRFSAFATIRNIKKDKSRKQKRVPYALCAQDYYNVDATLTPQLTLARIVSNIEKNVYHASKKITMQKTASTHFDKIQVPKGTGKTNASIVNPIVVTPNKYNRGKSRK
ncbi:unnamed protein product [Onchocerca flexuosa]|uniref:Uncharacterized protein n=1 Tax=Onchocerca flexuosa TaxID=387005 RepID=A0A183H4W2_9BILA|nr:unnamed protein product [Onchocerca flexuosa]